MLHFEFKNKKGRLIPVLLPDDPDEKYEARIALDRFFEIENPCLTFSKMMKRGEFDMMSEETVAEIAKFSNTIYKYWQSGDNPKEYNPDVNMLSLICSMLYDYSDYIIKQP